jgi:hypothetical protein
MRLDRVMHCNDLSSHKVPIHSSFKEMKTNVYFSSNMANGVLSFHTGTGTDFKNVNFIHIACDRRTRGYNLHVTGGHSDTICMLLAASRVQFLHALGASMVQSRQFYASTLPEQLFE